MDFEVAFYRTVLGVTRMLLHLQQKMKDF